MRFKPAIPYLLVVVIAATFLLPIVRVYLPTVDEGMYLNGAQMVMHGALPYRDFFEFVAPGEFYWIAIFFAAFGSTYMVARTLLLVAGVAITVLSFALSRRIGGLGYGAATTALVLTVPPMLMNSAHYDSNVLVLLAVITYLCVQRASSFWFLLPGFLAGVAEVFLQGKGVYIGLAFVAALGWQRREWKPCLLLIGGWAIAPLLEILWFASHGGFWDFLQAAIIWPLTRYSSVNAAPYAFPLAEKVANGWRVCAPYGYLAGPILLGALVVPCLYVAALPVLAPVLAFIHRRSISVPAVLWLAALALFASEFHRRDLGHLLHGTLLLSLLFFTISERSSKAWCRWFARAILLFVCCYGAGEVKNTVCMNALSIGRTGSLLMDAPDQVLHNLVARTHPGEEIFIYPYRPVYYFWAGLRNATRYTVLQYDFTAPGQFREAVSDLERKQVRLVLWDQEFSGERMRSVFPAYTPPKPADLVMEPYLLAHYHPVFAADGMTLLQRNGTR